MATKVFCDRCGKRLYREQEKERMIWENCRDDDIPVNVWDFCTDCASDMKIMIVKNISEYSEKHSKS